MSNTGRTFLIVAGIVVALALFAGCCLAGVLLFGPRGGPGQP